MSLLTWEKSNLTGVLRGSTAQEIEEDNQPSFIIDGTTLMYSRYSNVNIKVRCASVEDAKNMAEIIERGEVAE